MPKEKIFIPFVGSTYFREMDVSSVSTRDQYFQNVLLERVKNPITNKESFYLSPRPGFVRSSVTPTFGASSAVSGNNTRIILWNAAATYTGKLVEAGSTGTTTAELAVEGFSKVSNAAGTTDYIYPVYLKETFVGSTPTILLGMGPEIFSGTCDWYFHSEGGGLNKISTSDFPLTTNTGEMVYLGGYHFIMGKDGRIYNSALNSLSTWPGDYISCFSDPDRGVGLAVLGDELLAFGTNSIEFFRLSQSPVGSPLEKMLGKTIHIGAPGISRYSSRGLPILKYQDAIYFLAFLGGTQGNRIGVFKYDGSLTKISDPELDKYLIDSITGSVAGNAFQSAIGLLGCVFIAGSLHLIGTLDTRKFFCINLDLNNFVSYWDHGDLLSFSLHNVMFLSTPNGILYPSSVAGTKVYNINFSSFGDESTIGGSVSYNAIVQTGKIDFGTSRYKTFHQLRLVGEDPRSAGNSNWSVSWSDDDGATFSTARTINQASLNQWISGLGASRRRMFKFSFTADGTQVASRVEGFELEYTIHNS